MCARLTRELNYEVNLRVEQPALNVAASTERIENFLVRTQNDWKQYRDNANQAYHGNQRNPCDVVHKTSVILQHTSTVKDENKLCIMHIFTRKPCTAIFRIHLS